MLCCPIIIIVWCVYIYLLQVSLFAELFNEMLVRDFGFCIYNALLACPDNTQQDVKKDDGRKKGADKKGDSQKKDEKKCDKDNVDKGNIEVKKEATKDRTRDDDNTDVVEVLS